MIWLGTLKLAHIPKPPGKKRKWKDASHTCASLPKIRSCISKQLFIPPAQSPRQISWYIICYLTDKGTKSRKKHRSQDIQSPWGNFFSILTSYTCASGPGISFKNSLKLVRNDCIRQSTRQRIISRMSLMWNQAKILFPHRSILTRCGLSFLKQSVSNRWYIYSFKKVHLKILCHWLRCFKVQWHVQYLWVR